MVEKNWSWIGNNIEDFSSRPTMYWFVRISLFESDIDFFGVWFYFDIYDKVEIEFDGDSGYDSLESYYKKTGAVDKKIVTWNEALKIMKAVLVAKSKQIPELSPGAEEI